MGLNPMSAGDGFLRTTISTFFHVFIPILLGTTIYLLFRPTTLKVFSWVRYLGWEEAVMGAQATVSTQAKIIPNWILFSLPDGLWAYSLTCSMLMIWRDSASSQRYLWISMGLLLSLGGEFGQFVHLVPGVVDQLDVIVTFVMVLLALLWFKKEALRDAQIYRW